jgi:predicted ATPase
MLLVLDNCEHIIEACARLAAALLTGCPQLRILATSRERLGIRGERCYRVPPLSMPDANGNTACESAHKYEAVALFVERAREMLPDFTLTAENAAAIVAICHRLDGLPLALELAAARMTLWTPQALLARLDSRLRLLTGGPRDLPARQQTLRSAIAWSFDLLDEEERKLFRRLSLFAGGSTLEAAEAVCNGPGDLEMEVIDGLASLVEKSLLQHQEGADGEPRFVMLETIQEFARESLDAAEETAALRQHHAWFFLVLAETAEPKVRSIEQDEWLRRLAEEHDNLRAALAWAEETGVVETELRLAGALAGFWRVHGHLTEGRARLEKALARSAALGRTAARAKALHGCGELQHDPAAGHRCFSESLGIRRELGDRSGIARSLVHLAWTAQKSGDEVTAEALATESLTLMRELGNSWGLAAALNCLGTVALNRHEYPAARSFM